MTETAGKVNWVDDLPTYDGFSRHGPSIVRSFSLFSFFRSPAPSPPPSSLLQPLLTLPLDPPPTSAQITKSLNGLQTYLTQLKDHLVRSASEQREEKVNGDDAERLSLVLKAYTIAFFTVAKAVWTETGAEKPEIENLRKTLDKSLRGVFLAYRVLANSDSNTDDIKTVLDDTRKQLLASIFASHSESTLSLVTPLFERPRHLLQALTSANRPIAHAKAVSRASPPPHAIVNDRDALEITTLLETFIKGIQAVETLSGPVEAKTKAQKEADLRRPLRLNIEARLVRCDIALSMANWDIKTIKARAVEVAGVEDEESPEIVEKVNHDGIRWETRAKEALVGCLEAAKTLLDERREGVLSDRVDKPDWLGADPLVELAKATTYVSPKMELAVLKNGLKEEKKVEESKDELESDTESETSSSPDEAYPCPLRTLFRLHDRYEEQRLAVWLALPPTTRDGMGTYMRGEGGMVGDAWDSIGLLLLLDYDSDTLLLHGLSGDKLDKWVELASKRNAKKLRRRARKTN